MPIDYQATRQRLDREFDAVEEAALRGQPPTWKDAALRERFDEIFQSRTQAYREVLLGCILAKLQDLTIDIHKPYVGQGETSYNGRTLDERVVNPFLHDRRIPSSRGPFLSAFRRSVAFVPETRDGLRDKEGFDALLAIIDKVDEAKESYLLRTLRYTLYRLIELRDAAEIPLSRLQRLSLEQYDRLIEGLLDTPSGGRFPVLLIETAFTTIRDTFGLSWVIEVQGINAADRAVGVGGDITIRAGDAIIMAVEVTERPVDRNRVTATFQTKIAPQGIQDYLFFVRNEVGDDVLRQVRQYFAQGHEINFLQMRDWLRILLATLGRSGRETFNRIIIEKLQAAEIATALKVAWNYQIAQITDA